METVGFLPHRCAECGGVIDGDGDFTFDGHHGHYRTVHTRCRRANPARWRWTVKTVNIVL